MEGKQAKWQSRRAHLHRRSRPLLHLPEHPLRVLTSVAQTLSKFARAGQPHTVRAVSAWREMGRVVPFAPKLRSRLTAARAERGDAVGREILVVDDDGDVRESLSEVLSEAGYRVHAASSGEEALAMVPRLPRPCLILLDNNMPRMSGRDFLWRLVDVDDSARLPVILISATADVESATVPGVVATLWKPFDVAQLLELVAAHC